MDPFWQFFFRLFRAHRAALIAAVIFAFISAGGLGAGLLGLGPIFEIILAPDDRKTLPELAVEHNAEYAFPQIPQWVVARLPADPFDGVVLLLGGLAVLTIVGALANFLHQYISQTIATRAVAEIRAEAFDRALHMPLSRVLLRGPSEFVARIARDAAELQHGLIALVSKSLAQLTKGLAAFLVAIWFDWTLTLVAVLVGPLLVIALRKIGKRVRRGTRGSLQAQEGLLRIATESLQGLRAVKAATAEAAVEARFEAMNDEVVRHELRVRTVKALSGPVIETLAVFVIGALALLAAKSILAGTLSIDRFILSLGALALAGTSLKPLTGLVTEIQASAAPAQRLADALSEPIEEPLVGPGSAARPALARHGSSIEFERVTVRYPGAERAAVSSVSLRIGFGSRVAFVGPNGSGKTTLLSLLPRLLVPDSGRVLIDSVDVATVTLASLRRQIGVVTQEAVLFRGTVAENIAFGLENASRASIREAAERSHAHTFIEALPGGYDADLAEQGASLSGGQRQRLVIARAILRDPPIFILDEATSQIDAESEALIHTAITELSQNRTVLVIAHRLATVLDADRIVVMDAGRVVDQGRHDELLGRCELYQRLSNTQLIEV